MTIYATLSLAVAAAAFVITTYGIMSALAAMGMRDAGNLRLFGVAVVLSVAIAAAALMLGGAISACFNDDVAAKMKVGEARGCFEFWFNRYQSLLGNILTAAVAGRALFWAAGQLIAANKQVEAANRQGAIAAAQALRSVGADYQMIREKLEKFGNGVGTWSQQADLSKPYMAVSVSTDLNLRAKKIIDSAAAVLHPLEEVHLRTGAGEFYDLTEEIRVSVSRTLIFAGEVQVFVGRGDIANARDRLKSVYTECQNCIAITSRGLTLVRTRMKETWAAVQTFEQRAIGT